MTNTLLDTPKFQFSVSSVVQNACPFELEGVKLTHSDFLPKRTRVKDTGYDVRCADPNGILLEPLKYFKIPLGIRMFAPENWWAEIRPRSSIFMNDRIHALYGVVDQCYENILTFAGVYIPDKNDTIAANRSILIPFGKRIAQLIPVFRREMLVSEIDDTQYAEQCAIRNDSRGIGGYGSSGSV